MKLETGKWYCRRNGSVTQRVDSRAVAGDIWYDPETDYIYKIGGNGKVFEDRESPWDLVKGYTEDPEPMPKVDYDRFAQMQGAGAFAKPKQMTRAEYLAFVRQTFDDMLKLIEKKNLDYCGPTDDPFANFRRSTAVNVEPVNGLAVRFLDKVGRIESFLQAGKLENESFEDAWLDVIGYACLALGMLKEKSK